MIDFRKKSQYIYIDTNEVYIWLYKHQHYIAYGINGTSFHKTMEFTKDKNKILATIKSEMLKTNF